MLPCRYLASKFEKDSKRHWDIFYKHNSTHFFKDRHWLHREFTALAEAAEGERAAVLLEIGCGVGNAVFPLLEANPALFVHACDLSPRAVGFVKVRVKARLSVRWADVSPDSACSEPIVGKNSS